jgi:hypothetical protein
MPQARIVKVVFLLVLLPFVMTTGAASAAVTPGFGLAAKLNVNLISSFRPEDNSFKNNHFFNSNRAGRIHDTHASAVQRSVLMKPFVLLPISEVSPC